MVDATSGAFLPGNKNVQGLRYDSATRLHADVRFAARCSGLTAHSSPSPLLGGRRVIAVSACTPRVLIGHSILPEPESRYGLSLAHNDAFATIARSTFLACTFVSTSDTLANPFDSRLFRSVRFRGRTGATSTPGIRYPRRSPTFPIFPRSPLPLRSSFWENPPDQSVQPAPISGSPPHQTPDSPLLPARLPFDLLTDQRLKLASFSLVLRRSG
jgi:hypothetical protein